MCVMAGVSAHERSLIDGVLGAPAPAAAAQRRIEPGLALVLMTLIDQREQVLRVAVEPALRANHLNVRGVRVVFDDETPLPIVADWVGRAEVIVADVSQLNAAVLYVLGLCHGLRRCPLMIARSPVELPFDLGALRCLRYRTERESLIDLRNHLARALRIFLAAARHSGDADAASDQDVA
jgi:hypothetical protein